MITMYKNMCYFFVLLLVVASCDNNQQQPIEIGGNEAQEATASDIIEVTESQFELGQMQLGQMQEYDFSKSIRATGTIDVPIMNHVRVSAYAGGYIKNINLLPGERVGKGQVLFTLENPEFVQMQQEYLEAKAQLAYLQSDYERQKTLAAENIAAEKNYLKAESDYQITLTQMEGLKKRMSLLGIPTDELSAANLVSSISVHAPSSGYITEVNAMKGMFLNPTDVAVELVNTDHLHLELKVFEKDILKVKKGQKIWFKIPDSSKETFEGEVNLIGKSVEGNNRVVSVHGHLKKSAPSFVPGMFVDAEIVTDGSTSKGLPESAIVEVDNKSFILVSTGKSGSMHQFERKEIQPGIKKNGVVQVLNQDDFTAATSILISGAFNLISEE